MSEPRKLTGNWTPDGKAERLLAQHEYRQTTPGQRVEQAIVLSRVLSQLAVNGRKRRLREQRAGRDEDLIDLRKLREARGE